MEAHSDNIRDRVLVKVLSQFSKAQREGLREYLNCSLFNKVKIIEELFSLIEQRVFSARKKQVGIDEFLAGTSIPAKRLNKYFSQLLQLTNEYLELIQRKRAFGENYRYLFQAYSAMGMDEDVQQKEFKKAIKHLQKPPLAAENLHLEFYLSHTVQLDHIYSSRRKVPDHIVRNQHLLDNYYITFRLKYLCATRNMEWLFNLEKENLNEKEVVALYEMGEVNKFPLAQAYFKVLRLYSGWDLTELELYEIQELLKTQGLDFPRSDLVDLWGYVLNRCIGLISRGKDHVNKIADAIYLHLIEQEYLLDEGKLSAFHFNNVVKFRLSAGAYTWVSDFIAHYEDKLINDMDGHAVQYARGLWFYYSENFKEAISIFKQLLQTLPNDIFWNIDVRSLLLKSCFGYRDDLSREERDEFELLSESFRVFVARNEKIPVSDRKGYQNFIRFFNRFRVMLPPADPNPTQVTALIEEVRQEVQTSSRLWLLKNMRKHFPQAFAESVE